jgi:hypothetical protein
LLNFSDTICEPSPGLAQHFRPILQEGSACLVRLCAANEGGWPNLDTRSVTESFVIA